MKPERSALIFACSLIMSYGRLFYDNQLIINKSKKKKKRSKLECKHKIILTRETDVI